MPDPESTKRNMKIKVTVAVTVAVVIILVIVLIFIYMRRSASCPSGAAFIMSGEQVTAEEACEQMGSSWDAGSNSCVHSALNDICPGKSEIVDQRLCPLVGGIWHSKCKICHGVTMTANGEIDAPPSPELVNNIITVYQEECPAVLGADCTIL